MDVNNFCACSQAATQIDVPGCDGDNAVVTGHRSGIHYCQGAITSDLIISINHHGLAFGGSRNIVVDDDPCACYEGECAFIDDATCGCLERKCCSSFELSLVCTDHHVEAIFSAGVVTVSIQKHHIHICGDINLNHHTMELMFEILVCVDEFSSLSEQPQAERP